ncbi:MAG: hypothetical protein ABW321_18760 [Polyangiales bacterium]
MPPYAGTPLAWCLVIWAAVSLGVACGRTSIVPAGEGGLGAGELERCNQRDDDYDGRVDEAFRDTRGRYVDDAHCGACGNACSEPIAHAAVQGCTLLDEAPACAALRCEPGYGVAQSGRCVALGDRACMTCRTDRDCGPLASGVCLTLPTGQYCSIRCDDGCPDGYVCGAIAGGDEYCLPAHGDCACDPGRSFARACVVTGPEATCLGHERCDAGELTACTADREQCDGTDDDCDGRIDEDFVDEHGAYSRDDAHCGGCGIDCGALGELDARELRCGGDPYAPRCVLACPDAADGVQVGDRLDADGQAESGCECIVQSDRDAPDQRLSAEGIDENCDGADGDVRESFYVAPGGDDSGPGSPTRPFASITRGVEAATATLRSTESAVAMSASASSGGSALPMNGSAPSGWRASSGGSALPMNGSARASVRVGADAAQVPMVARPHVLVAAGTYIEHVRLPVGVQLHGGYRRDFTLRDPTLFEVAIIAPGGSPGGVGLDVDAAGDLDTVVEGLRVQGASAEQPGQPAIALRVVGAGSRLALRELVLHAGRAGAGQPGAHGSAAGSAADGGEGEPPHSAREDAAHSCIEEPDNQTRGGAGGVGRCSTREVSGGDGGSASCPRFATLASAGRPGLGAGAGAPGQGGSAVSAPVTDPSVCAGICCGLADFNAPPLPVRASAGERGAPGVDGVPGLACSDPLGRFDDDGWRAGTAQAGTAGTPGSGGGGGGAGGGVELAWQAEAFCAFADGIAGAGGGGGAGGCGGDAGGAGESAGPVIAALIAVDSRQGGGSPRLERLTFETEPAADGGDGGSGGDGGLGGRGGSGGALSRDQLTTPTLAGAAPGERGGEGGRGGTGGGGGGGCGGSSVGLWLTGIGADSPLVAAVRSESVFRLGAVGRGGRGGGGVVTAADGVEGRSVDVVVR